MTTSDTSTTGTARLKSNASSSIANAGQLGRADFVSNAIGFVSASEKKLAAFQGGETASNRSRAAQLSAKSLLRLNL